MKIQFKFEAFRKVREGKLPLGDITKKKVGLDFRTIKRLEAGKSITLSRFIRACEILEIHPATFFEVE